MFDTVAKALAYLRDSASLLWNARTVLEARLSRIALLMADAKAVNDQPSLGKLILAKSQTEALLREQARIADKVNPFSSWFSSTPTMGALPLVPVYVAAGAVGLATTLYLFLEKVRNEGKALDLVKAGILKPAEVREMLTGGPGSLLSNVSTIVTMAVIGYALVMFGPMLVKR